MKYVGNAFGISMLKDYEGMVRFTRLTEKEFCYNVKEAKINYIGHKGTVDIVNKLCGTSLTPNRIQVTVSPGDELYIVTLNVRIDEGKVLSEEELQKMLDEGKIIFVKAVIN